MASMKIKKIKPSLLYFAPCEPGQGMGGGGRLRNMLSILESQAKTSLIMYLSKEKLGLFQRYNSPYLYMTGVYTNKGMPKILKVIALIPIFYYGARYSRKCNIIISHAPTLVTGFPALILSKIFRKPLIIDHMDIKDPDTPGFIYELILKKSDIVLVLSRYLENEVKCLGNKNVIFLPNFIDTDMFKRDETARKELMDELGINERDILIGYAGSFSRGEGLNHILRAFERISNRYASTKLLIIGGRNVPDSENIPDLVRELKIENRVMLIPPQPHDKVPKYLSVCDILCSFQLDCDLNRAAAPIKVYEYMAMEVPVIASRIGEIQYVIEDGVDGFLVNVNDERDLETKMEYIIENLGCLHEVGVRARKKIVDNYSKGIFLEKIEIILRGVR